MAEIEITGIRKDNGDHDNPHEAVTHYQWVEPGTNNGAITARNTVVEWLENGVDGATVKAYVERVQPKVYCYVSESPYGTKFLETYADDTHENNLLRLPEV